MRFAATSVVPAALRGAEGVTCPHAVSGGGGREQRTQVLVTTPPSAVAAYPAGLYLPDSALTPTGPADLALLPEEAWRPLSTAEQLYVMETGGLTLEEMRLDSTLKERFRNSSISQAKDECLHGAPRATTAITSSLLAMYSALEGYETADETIACLDAHCRANTRGCLETLRLATLSIATDMALAEDWPSTRRHCRYAEAITCFLANGVAVATPDNADFERSPWHLKRYLALNCPCRCFSRKYSVECSNPGCNARRGGGVTMRACSACLVSYYCSVECSAAHWPVHKQQCKRENDKGNAKSSSRSKV